jgi:hypothetical protein
MLVWENLAGAGEVFFFYRNFGKNLESEQSE